MAQETLFRLLEVETSELAPDSDYREAMSKAGGILARRAHSVAELRTKLDPFEPEVAERVVARLRELRLLDDADFARRWVEERSSRRGPQALLAELEGKGVDREVAAAAVAVVETDEVSRATDLAARYLQRVADRPLPKQAAAIQAMLLRRGYGSEASEEATKAVLPPDGWD
jgi:regulatory protein